MNIVRTVEYAVIYFLSSLSPFIFILARSIPYRKMAFKLAQINALLEGLITCKIIICECDAMVSSRGPRPLFGRWEWFSRYWKLPTYR